MFFVIAGVQPKTRTLDNAPRRCPRCGLHQAYTQRVDHYFSLFFIPLVRVRHGEPYLFCRRCNQTVASSDDGQSSDPPTGHRAGPACHRCGRTLDRVFAFCPFCGQRQ